MESDEAELAQALDKWTCKIIRRHWKHRNDDLFRDQTRTLIRVMVDNLRRLREKYA